MNLLNCVEPNNYFLPQNQRIYFKKPLGKIIQSQKNVIAFVQNLFSDKNIPKIISVGDATTEVLTSLSLMPDIAIIDEHIQRERVSLLKLEDFIVLEAINEAGYIMRNAWNIIADSIKIEDNKIVIKITGEEDLLVLPTILEAPLDSKVLYGQPNEGLVVVSVTEEIKQNVCELMRKMVKINEN